MLSRVVRPVARIAQRGARKYHDDKPFKYASMDEVPVPQGSWQATYDANQRKYNMQLAAGIIIFAITFTYAKSEWCPLPQRYYSNTKQEIGISNK